MKPAFFTLLTLALAAVLLLSPAGAALLAQEPAPSRPPGVPEASWIPLSERAGILVTRLRPNGVDGRLMIEINGRWINANLTADPRILPAH